MKIVDMEVTLIDSMGSDLSVVNAARVSFDKEAEWEWPSDSYEPLLKQPDRKLINYLAKHKHHSPFNHCFASFRVKAPIFVARQLVKHEYMPWNEVSRRYVDSEPEFYFPEYWRKKADNVKQGSSEEAAEGVYATWTYEVVERTLDAYLHMLHKGVCAEQARMILPQNTMTEWIWSGTLNAIAKMCRLRLDPHTQKETQVIAQKISEHMKELYPVSWQALMEIN